MATVGSGQGPKFAAMRMLFTALFDAVDASGDFDEGRWEDLMAVFSAAGRLVMGWPRHISREEDLFGALDDITDQLEATKRAIEQTTKEARVVMHDIHEALGPADDEPEPPMAPTIDVKETVAPAVERQVIDPPTPDPTSAVKHSDQVDPVTPSDRDETLFAAIRADPTITMAAAERVAGLAASRGVQRMDLLDSYGTLPSDIKEWRIARSKARGVPKGVHSQTLGKELSGPKVVPHTIKEALSFNDRRSESAKEASERTWRERHPAQLAARASG